MPRGQVNAFLHAFAVKDRHHEPVHRDQREVVRIEEILELGDMIAVLQQFIHEPLGKTQFDGKHFAGKYRLLDPHHVAFENRPKFRERGVRENV